MEELNNLIKLVSEHSGLDITKKTRKREYVEARAVYYKLARAESYSLTDIGKSVGVDHATVIHSLNNFHLIEKYNKKFYSIYLSLSLDEDQKDYFSIKNELLSLRNDYKVLRDNYNRITSGDNYIENTYKSLSDENKSIFKVRVEAILNMMTT